MALLDRVKERTGADLSDTELTAMITSITAEIDAIHGAASGAIDVTLGDPDTEERWQKSLTLARPIDTAQPVTIVEIEPVDSGLTGSRVTLDSTDYRVLHAGRTLQRLVSGTHGQSYWAPLVELTYTPVALVPQSMRDETVIKIIQLDLSYRGLIKSERAGDYQWSGSLASDSYQVERQNLINALAGPDRLVMA